MKTYSDGTKVLSWEKALEVLTTYSNSIKVDKRNPDKKTINALQQIILLLGASDKELYGNTRLQKESFLIANEYSRRLKRTEKVNLEDLQFVPYHLGPYSFKLAEFTSALVQGGYVNHGGKKNSNNHFYYLTKKGKNWFNKLKNENPKFVNIVSTARKELDEFSTSALLKYIYNKPEYKIYTIKSKVKGKYMDITWGRNKL